MIKKIESKSYMIENKIIEKLENNSVQYVKRISYASFETSCERLRRVTFCSRLLCSYVEHEEHVGHVEVELVLFVSDRDDGLELGSLSNG